MTPERTRKLQKVLKLRQRSLTVVLENVFDPHNISAVMRTCDSVGIQDIYVLNTKIPKHKKWGEKSSSSAAKWLTIHQYEDVTACFNALHTAGYKIITTWLGDGSVNLYAMDFTQPLAIVFGNEHSGVSDEIRDLADGNMMIPQAGIIQSLNISVASLHNVMMSCGNNGVRTYNFGFVNCDLLMNKVTNTFLIFAYYHSH